MTGNKEHLANIEATNKEVLEKTEVVNRLRKSHDSVMQHLAATQNSAEMEVKEAFEREQIIAQQFAAAVADGIPANQLKNLQADLKKAADALADARRKQSEGDGLISALEAQAHQIAEKLAQADSELALARQKVKQAKTVVATERWNAVADELTKIGSELVDLLPENGFYAFKDMRLPIFNRQQSAIRRSDLVELAGHAPVQAG